MRGGFFTELITQKYGKLCRHERVLGSVRSHSGVVGPPGIAVSAD